MTRNAPTVSLALVGALLVLAWPAGAQAQQGPDGALLERAWGSPGWRPWWEAGEADAGLLPLQGGPAPATADAPHAPTPRPYAGKVFEPFGNDPGDVSLRLPRLRIELTARLAGLMQTKLKHGPAFAAHTFMPTRDAHLPREPMWGGRALLELRFHESLAVGVHYTRLQLHGPPRHVRYHGVSLGTTYFPPDGPRVRTSLDIQQGDVFLRYVVLDDVRFRLGFGLGAGWASMRLQMRGVTRHEGGRVETFFAPTIGYFLALRLLPDTYFYVESSTGLFAPWRFPSFYSEARVGLRYHLGQGVELLLGLSFTSAQIEDVDDLWGGKPDRPDHRWRQGSWSAVGGEVGFSYTF